MDDDGFGGSLVDAAPGSTLAQAPADARWTAPCERCKVREGLIVSGIASGSRQIQRGTSDQDFDEARDWVKDILESR